MIIPSKFNGYVNGVRLYNGGGSGGGASASVADSGGTGSNPGFSITGDGSTNIANAAPAVAPWGTTANSKADYYNTQIGAGQTDAQIRSSIEGNTQFGGPQSSSDWDYLTSLARSRAPVPWGNTQESKAAYYNSQLGKGQNDAQIRSAVEANPFGGAQSNVDWNTLIQTAAMNNSTGRPLAGSGQFYQPVYQGQYQNYNTGNSMGISQYGQQPPSGIPQMQNPFSMYGGQMMGGGYGQFGDNNPYSPYSNSFLNMPSNLNQGTMQEKANFYGGAIGQGFNDQQLYNQASGLFGQQSPRDWGYLQGTAMGMTPGLGQGSMQDKVGFYNQARGQGFSDNSIRNAANQMIGQQSPQDWSYLQNAATEQQRRYAQPGQDYRTVSQQQMQQPMSQQNQPIFSRSSMGRRTGPIRNYEEGGIASLLDTE
jgi:hypothetical protein